MYRQWEKKKPVYIHKTSMGRVRQTPQYPNIWGLGIATVSREQIVGGEAKRETKIYWMDSMDKAVSPPSSLFYSPYCDKLPSIHIEKNTSDSW